MYPVYTPRASNQLGTHLEQLNRKEGRVLKQPRELVAPTAVPETIPHREGEIDIDRFGVVTVRPLGPNTWMVLGKYDLIELTRKAFGCDSLVLEGLATNMRLGHRWAVDPITGDDEPF